MVPQRTAFTNLSQLINANQQNRLGNTIQSGVNKDVSGLKQDVNQATQQFGNDVSNANLNTQANQGYVSNAINNIVNPAPPANVNAPQGQVAPDRTTQGNGGMINGQGPTQPGMVQALETAPTVSQVQTQNAKASQPAGASTAATTPAPSQTQASNLNALPGSFGYASNATSGTNQTATTGAPNAGDVSKFGQYLSGAYSGPQQLANYAALQAKGANLQDVGQNALRQGGLQNLLQQYINSGGNNQYTRGEQALDTAILGQTGKPQLQNILNTTKGAGLVPQQAEANAENLAAQTAAGNQAFGRNVASQLSSAETPLLQQIQQQIQDQNTKNSSIQDAANSVYGYLNNPLAPTNNPINKVGLPPGVIATPTTANQAALDALNSASNNGLISQQDLSTISQNIPLLQKQGLDLQTILKNSYNPYTAPTSDYTVQQGASADQATKLNALNQLAGLGNQFGTYGGMNPGTAGFDMAKFLNQIQGSAAAPTMAASPTAPLGDVLNQPASAINGIVTNPLGTIENYLNPTSISHVIPGVSSYLPKISIGGWSPW